MMQKALDQKIIWLVVLTIMGSIFWGTVGVLAVDDYGAQGAKQVENYTLEEMLVYAIQDEYLARAAYELIMDEFGSQRPFSNIIKAEVYHIQLLMPLFEKYNISLPEDTASEHVVLPADIEAALQTGVEAEVANIEMYENFLKKDLPADVVEVFKELKRGSENHLRAFKTGLNRNYGYGKGYKG